MLPYLTGTFANPSGQPPRVPAGPAGRGRRPGTAGRPARGRPRGDRVHLWGDRGRQSGHHGGWEATASADGAPPRPVVCSAMEHHAVLNACRGVGQTHRGRAARGAPGQGRVHRPRSPVRGVHGRGRAGVGDGRQQRDRDGAAPRGGGRGGPAGVPVGRAAHRCRAGRALARCRAVDRGHRSPGASAPTSSAARRASGPWWCGAGLDLPPTAHGGGQERGRRSGTHNVAGIVAMAAALAVTDAGRSATWSRVAALRDRLGDGLLATVPGAVETGDREPQGGRQPASPHRRGGERGAGGPARRGRAWPHRPGRPVPAGRWRTAMSCCPWDWVTKRPERHPVLPRAPPPPRPRSTTPWPSSRARLPSCETEPMRVLVAMSGGVDSSVAAALLAEQLGPDRVVGATLKLWGGSSDSGCCSVADVEDARRVADQLGVVHRVFNFGAEFEERVVEPYVQGHAEGRTPNPCIECNRHIKFDRLFERARTPGVRRRGHRSPRPVRAHPGGSLPAVPGGRPAEGPVLRAGHAGPGAAGPGPLPGGGDDQGPGAGGGGAARTAHGGQAGQPGRLLHPIGRGAPGLSGRAPRAPPGPAGRPRHRGRPRRGRGGGAGHGGPAPGDGARERRPSSVRHRGRRAGPPGLGRHARGGPCRRGPAPHRDVGGRRPHLAVGRPARTTGPDRGRGPVQRPRPSGAGRPCSPVGTGPDRDGSPPPSGGSPRARPWPSTTRTDPTR